MPWPARPLDASVVLGMEHNPLYVPAFHPAVIQYGPGAATHESTNNCADNDSGLPALPAATARVALVPERTEFLEGDSPAAAKVEAFLAQALAATGSEANITAGALVPWICDALLSNHSVKAYGRDLMDFLRHMQAQGVTPLEVTADHVKMYKRAFWKPAGPRPPSRGGSPSSAAPTSSLPPRGSSPGRRPRTSVR